MRSEVCKFYVLRFDLVVGFERRNGMSPIVLQLHDDIVEWQLDNDCMRLPGMEEQRSLAQRIQNYLDKDKKVRVASMTQAFPSDAASVHALQLDCLELSDDMEGGVKWRSDAERTLVQSIAGWHEGYVPQPSFVPLTDLLFSNDEALVSRDVQDVFLLLQDVNLSFDVKLGRVAAILDCTPTIMQRYWGSFVPSPPLSAW